MKSGYSICELSVFIANLLSCKPSAWFRGATWEWCFAWKWFLDFATACYAFAPTMLLGVGCLIEACREGLFVECFGGFIASESFIKGNFFAFVGFERPR